MLSGRCRQDVFPLTSVTSDGILKEIKRLDIKQTTQESDIPIKIIKQFPGLIVDFLKKNINCCLTQGTFRNGFKNGLKKIVKLKNITIDQLASFKFF